MLTIVTKQTEGWDEANQKFVYSQGGKTLQLEHSLISVSRWEERHHKCFMDAVDQRNRSVKLEPEEMLDYILCMVVRPVDVTIDDIKTLSSEDIEEIGKYINDPASATTLNKKELEIMNRGPRRNSESMTSEMIYYYMAEFRLPAEYQKWRLPRLLNLITLCNMKEWEKDPKNKKKLAFAGNNNMSMAKTYYEINKRRCEQMGTTG